MTNDSKWMKTDLVGEKTACCSGILYSNSNFPGLYIQTHAEYYGAAQAVLVFDKQIEQIARFAGLRLKDVKVGLLDNELTKLLEVY